MALKQIIAPATYPVSLADAKAHLNVPHDDDDDLIELYIKAVTQNIDGPEGFLGRALIDQTWDLYLSCFPIDGIKIPLPPLISVIGVFYRDIGGVEQEFSSTKYEVNDVGEYTRVALVTSASWPSVNTSSVNAVRVRFRAGYLDASSPPVAAVPFAIKAGLLQMIGSLYAHRETVVVGATAVKLPWGAEQLLRPYRVHLGLA